MRRPIGYCLHWPERAREPVSTLDLAAIGQLTFERPDLQRFPALGLAMEVLKQGGGAATVLNAANEVAVEAFLAGRVAFTAIPQIVEIALTAADSEGLLAAPSSIDEALELDAVARRLARADLKRRSAVA
jgi:1-deoxy-D-xylulose-5-phosphate reductoisomerase